MLDVYRGNMQINGTIDIELEIHDTSGESSFCRERNISYHQADIIMICVPVDNPESLDRVTDWLLEIRSKEVRKSTPVALILTKKDLSS